MLFTDIFMMFINIEQPQQNAEFCNSHKQKVLNMQVSDCPGANIIKVAKHAVSNIVAVVCGKVLDSTKNNIAPTRILIEAGGKGNNECTHSCFNCQPL